MRNLALPKLLVRPEAEERRVTGFNMSNSPYASTTSVHSRDSSAASDNYSPITPTFSLRDHARISTSSSSLATSPPSYEQPDSPTSVSKTVLHDLVEDPEEIDDRSDMCEYLREHRPCSCDDKCNHDCHFATYPPPSRFSLDYDLADGFCSDGEASLRSTGRSRGSSDAPSPVAQLASRLGHRLPSLSRRLKERNPTTSVTRQGIRSAPPSRTSSFRLSSLTKSLSTHLELRDTLTPPDTPVELPREQAPQAAPPVDITLPKVEDPIDRQALASTPLLPPLMTERRNSDSDSPQSPLQSPTVAASSTFSFMSSANSTPILQAMQTPPLSTRPSIASFGMTRSTHVAPVIETSPPAINDADDRWASLLGHANFAIFPEPYLPEKCDASACRRLTDDWEWARKQYMNHAAHTSEHYGPTSQTYKFTENKWAEIDSQWKRNHEIAASRAAANGEPTIFQPLAESAPLSKMPSIDGPESWGKFPTIEDAGIVGPMVQYVKIHHGHSKKSAFFRFFDGLRLSNPPSTRVSSR